MKKSTKNTKPNAPPLESKSKKAPNALSLITGGVEPVVVYPIRPLVVYPIEGEPFRFMVQSETTEEKYLVDIQDLGFTGACNCMGYLVRIAPKVAFGLRGPDGRCKHILAAREFFLEYVLPKLAFAMGMEEPDILVSPKPTTEYMRKRYVFLSKYRKCAVFPALIATQIHHAFGRLNTLLLEDRLWIPVSMIGHQWIDAHRNEARERTWNGIPLLAPLGEWNNPSKERVNLISK